ARRGARHRPRARPDLIGGAAAPTPIDWYGPAHGTDRERPLSGGLGGSRALHRPLAPPPPAEGHRVPPPALRRSLVAGDPAGLAPRAVEAGGGPGRPRRGLRGHPGGH